MINHDKWINSLPKAHASFNNASYQVNAEKFIDTIPEKQKYNSVKKYSFMIAFFICGFLLVSIVKNETRILQKEINNLRTSINLINFNLNEAILDNEVIKSPENISYLANKYLNEDLTFYERSQIKKINESGDEKIDKKEKKKLSNKIKINVEKRIEQKKVELAKLQEMYSNPEAIPGEVKSRIVKQLEEKKAELENIYNSPKDAISLKKIGKWGVIQVVKAFLGMPIVPGR